MVSFDAVVVGGSIAGSVTARELARRGLSVALVDKARFPRPKACGEGLLPHGVKALQEMGLEAPGIRVCGIRFVSPAGLTAEADFPAGPGVVVRRDRFDAMLFRAAADTPGVVAFEGIPYESGRFSARWTVGADGIRSQFHRQPEFRALPPALKRAGLSTHVRGLKVDRSRVEVILHGGGEVYLAPSDGDEALVTCLFNERAIAAGETLEARVARQLHSIDALQGRIRGLEFTTPVLAVAPLGLKVESVVAGSVVLVGDAAGAPDPITGEGMSLGILSARSAAAAIAAGRPEDYVRERRRLASGSEWLGRWMLRATRIPAVADRVVGSLAKRPYLFSRLLEVALGIRDEGDLTLVEVAQLVV